MIWMEGDDLDTLWVYAGGYTCTLTTDWKTEGVEEDGAWGFFVSDPDGTCPYVEDEGWTYSWLESDEEGNPISIAGPYGGTWYFTEPSVYEGWDEYDLDMEYETDMDWYNYLTSDDSDAYAMIWMEGDDLDTLWVWD